MLVIYVYIYICPCQYIAMHILCITIKLHIGLALMHTRYVAFADHRSAKMPVAMQDAIHNMHN